MDLNKDNGLSVFKNNSGAKSGKKWKIFQSLFRQNDLQIIKEALKEHAESSFKKYNLLNELNLSKDEYNPLKNLSLLMNIIIYK